VCKRREPECELQSVGDAPEQAAETRLAAPITLTTDFGLRDPFVGIMKGVILSINSEARIVDLTHQVESFDVIDGALALAQSYRYFPLGTIHVVVVDPGVGSERRPIVVSTPSHHFVGPDNGVFSLIYEREASLAVRHITAGRYFLQPVSLTFHGRDVFAPIAAWLSTGLETEKLGGVITDYVRLAVAKPERVSAGVIRGAVLRVDNFGNLITNFTPMHLPAEGSFNFLVNRARVTRLVSSFAEGHEHEVFAIAGSAGFIEIAARQSSAAEALGARKGTEVILEIA
jgi:S-adenosyl-L-methionine hydrolase (adenosine-forming)